MKLLIQETDTKKNPASKLLTTNFLGCNSVFLEKNLFLETKFNPNRTLASSEDWELWLRVITGKELVGCETTFRMLHHANRSLLTITPD